MYSSMTWFSKCCQNEKIDACFFRIICILDLGKTDYRYNTNINIGM